MNDFPLEPGETTTVEELKAMFPDATFIGLDRDTDDDEDE